MVDDTKFDRRGLPGFVNWYGHVGCALALAVPLCGGFYKTAPRGRMVVFSGRTKRSKFDRLRAPPHGAKASVNAGVWLAKPYIFLRYAKTIIRMHVIRLP